MLKMEMKNNKREIAKVLNGLDFNEAEVNVFAWLNFAWNEELGHHDTYDVMIEVMYGIGDKRNTSLTWRQFSVIDENNNKVMRQVFKATCELAEWLNIKYGITVANDDWLIID